MSVSFSSLSLMSVSSSSSSLMSVSSSSSSLMSVSSSSSSLSSGEASSTFAYFPDKKFLLENFHEVDLDKKEPQPGDLFLFGLQIPKANIIGAHAGVYCGDGEIIHFMVMSDSVTEMLVEDCEGVVYKEGLRQLNRNRKLLRVLRKRGGVNTKLLKRRVYEAMNRDPPRYNLKDNNCMHFALKLLGMDSMTTYMDSPMDIIKGLTGNVLKNLLHKD